MRPVTVLITGAGTANHHGVVRGLRQEREIPLRILSCDMDDDNAGRYLTDGFVRVPPAASAGYAEAMLDVCRVYAVDLLIPIVEYELPRLAAVADHLSALRCRLALSPAAAVDTCLDKFETFRFLVERGLPTPHTWLPEQLPAELPFPLFLKPRRFGRSSIGCHWITDHAGLSYHLARASDPIVQPALTGRLRSVDMLSDFDGNVIGGVVRETLEAKSGVVTKATAVDDPELLRIATAAAGALGMVGAYGMDCLRTDRGVFILEVNARFQSATALTSAAGFNIPQLLLHLALGRSVAPRPIDQAPPAIRMLRFWSEVFTDAQGRSLES